MKKFFLILIAFTVLFITAVGKANAQYGCPPYGGECPPTSQLVVDKFIKDPNQKGDIYVDNLTLSNYRFSPGEDVIFKIIVKNAGSRTLYNVQVKDTLPVYTNYMLESGETKSSIRDITKSYDLLNADESRQFYLRVRVKPGDEIAEGLTCGDPNAINRVTAWADGQPNTYDSSSFCIEKGVMGAVAQPEAGAELWIIALGLLTVSGFGLFGRKLFARI